MRYLYSIIAVLVVGFGTCWANAAEPTVKFAWSPGNSQKKVSQIDCVLVSVEPVASIEGKLLEDAITVELFLSNTKVVGRAKTVQLTNELARKHRSKVEKEGDPNDEADVPVDFLQVAKAGGAQAVLSVTVLANQIQMNVYDKTTARVQEVQSVFRIHMVSMTLVDTTSGDILAAAIAEYEPGALPSKVAADLVGKLKPKATK